MSLVFNLEDSFKLFMDAQFSQYVDYKKYWVAGLQTKPRSVESYGRSKMIMVQFKPAGAFILLRDPLHYYTNDYVNLDTIFSQEAEDIWQQLQETKNMNQQVRIVEHFLFQKISKATLPSKKMLNSIDLLFSETRHLSIQQICSQLNISRKHLNDLTKNFAGVSPKTLSSLHRLQKTLQTMSASSGDKLTDLAYELDYFDQAHFINDFRRLTDLKPSDYAKIVGKKRSLKLVPHFIPFD